MISLEMAFCLPILCVVLLAMLQFSLLFVARGQIIDASRVGARTATLPGANQDDVQRDVLQALGGRLGQYAQVQTELGVQTGDLCRVTVKVPMVAVSPDLLWPVGFSIQNQYLYGDSAMSKE